MRTILLFVVGACAPKVTPVEPAAAPVDAPAVQESPEPAPEILPPPFSAAEIRDGMPLGTVIRYELSPGEVAKMQWTVTAADEAGCTIQTVLIDADGQPVGEPTTRDHTWDALESHAHFPPGTTRERTLVKVPAGSFAGWTYKVTDTTEDGAPVIRTYHFADALPGAPVRVLETGEGNEVLHRMALLSHEKVK